MMRADFSNEHPVFPFARTLHSSGRRLAVRCAAEVKMGAERPATTGHGCVSELSIPEALTDAWPLWDTEAAWAVSPARAPVVAPQATIGCCGCLLDVGLVLADGMGFSLRMDDED